MKTTAQMGGLTRAAVEQADKLLQFERLPLSSIHANGLTIDLYQWAHALRTLASPLESVRSEARNAALEEAAKVCAKVASPEHWRPLSREAACIECAAAIRALGSALSPARVAEEKDVHDNELRK